jgi:hypothetical protein
MEEQRFINSHNNPEEETEEFSNVVYMVYNAIVI